MHIILTGLNHKTAPLEVRESVSFSKEQLVDVLPRLADIVGDGVILSTCNRTEIYTVTNKAARTADAITRYISEVNSHRPLDQYLYHYTDAQAVQHLFKVASGLDSMILGESQILGQVRDALTEAAKSGSLRMPVSRLFHHAIRTGRRVREETDVGRNALSISSAGVQLSKRVLGNIQGFKVLLIGAGEAGKLVARALHSSGAGKMQITNRTPERAEKLACQMGGSAIPYDQIGRHLVDADVAITATEAPRYVLTKKVIDAVTAHRNGRTLFLLDLSVPRNIDPASATSKRVSLFNIDDLSSIAEENLSRRWSSVSAAETIVEQEAARFMKWWDSLDAVPMIKQIRRRADGIRKRELAYARRKLNTLSPEDAKVLDAMTRSIVSRLLHDPTMALKQRTDEDYIRVATDLFAL